MMPNVSKFVAVLVCAALGGAAALLTPAPAVAQVAAKNTARLEAQKRVTEKLPWSRGYN